MVSNIGAIQPAGLFQYTPSFMPNYSDIDDLDMISNPYSMYGSIFGMNGAIPPAMNTGFDPNKSYFDNMKDYQKQWNDYYVDQQKINRQNEVQVNAPMEAIRETASNLKDKILHDEQDQIEAAYKKYYNSVKNAYGDASEEEINSRALSLYTQLNGGKTLIQDLRENGHSSFLQGFIQTATLGLYAQKSAEDNIADITNQEVPMGEKVLQNIGRIAGVGAVGTGAYGITKLLSGNTGKILKGFGKFMTSKAGIISLVVAGAVAAKTLFSSKVTA